MPLKPGRRQFLEVPMPDLRPGIKRRMRYKNMHQPQNDQGELSLQMDVCIILFDEDPAQPDGYGPELRNPNVVVFPVSFDGQNDTLVDAATGAVLRTFGNWESAEAKQAAIASYPQVTMWQGDWFEEMRATSDRPSDEVMILYHMQQVVASGRFN